MSNAAPTTPCADPASLQPEPGLSFPKAPRLPRCAPVQGVPVSAASPATLLLRSAGTEAELSAYGSATNETMSLTHWLHAVALISRVNPTGAQRERMVRAYQAGEPVWMAADEMCLYQRASRFVVEVGPGDSIAFFLRSGK